MTEIGGRGVGENVGGRGGEKHYNHILRNSLHASSLGPVNRTGGWDKKKRGRATQASKGREFTAILAQSTIQRAD